MEESLAMPGKMVILVPFCLVAELVLAYWEFLQASAIHEDHFLIKIMAIEMALSRCSLELSLKPAH